MRKNYEANFIRQSVIILTPVLVFLGPFVAVSIAMQWDFLADDTSDLFYGIFSGAVIWFLVCVSACLCTALPDRTMPPDSIGGKGVKTYGQKIRWFSLMLVIITIGLVVTNRYDIAAKRTRYEIVHKKLCQLELSIPLQKLQQVHETYGQDDQGRWNTKDLKNAYEETLTSVAGWMDTNRWEMSVVYSSHDGFTLVSSDTDFLPVKKKTLHDYPGFEQISASSEPSICQMVIVDEKWNSLRTFIYAGQKSIFILARAKIRNGHR